MKKTFLTFLFVVTASCCVSGQQPQDLPDDCPPPPADHHRKPNPKPDFKPCLDIPVDEIFKLMPEENVPRLKMLYQEDKEAFYSEVHEVLEEKRRAEMKEIQSLQKRYAEAKSDEERNAIREELRKKASVVFDRVVRMSRQRIDASEKRIKKLQANVDKSKKKLDETLKKKDVILDRMVDDILSGKKTENMPEPPSNRPPERPHHGHDVPPPPPPED